jgi:23S rRNA (adenine2503-C2)-methyltransferase
MSVKLIESIIGDVTVSVMIINLAKQSIISLPTQLGCAIGCTFCLSSDNTFIRNLTPSEMITLVETGLSHCHHDSALISFTGEGEPFLNLKNINSAMETLHTRSAVNAFRLCTSGIKPNLFGQVSRFSKPLRLQLSLHSPFDDARKQLIPKSVPLTRIVDALTQQTDHFDEVAINYVLMKGINDSDRDNAALTKMLDSRWLVKFNPLLDETRFQRSDRTQDFIDSIIKAGKQAIAFSKVGSSIKNGLYGQLTYAQNNPII